jgi:hypothetical protein
MCMCMHGCTYLGGPISLADKQTTQRDKFLTYACIHIGGMQVFMSKWDASTAGGSLNTDKFDVNPQFKVIITGAGPQVLFVKVEVLGDVDYSVGLHLYAGGQRVHRRSSQGKIHSVHINGSPRTQ